MLYRFCPHMGTDLANGCIIENCVRCPLHHWKFDKNGIRAESGFGDSPQQPVKTQYLPVQEKYGIIFAYWGRNPEFQPPTLPDSLNLLYSNPITMQLNNSYVAVILNAFDVQHLTAVHNRIIDGEITFNNESIYHLGIKFSLRVSRKKLLDSMLIMSGMGSSEIQYNCWGGNYLIVQNPTTKFCAVMILQPSERVDESKLFLVVATSIASKNFINAFITKQKLRIMRFFAVSFLQQDVRILKNMRPVLGLSSPEKDIGAIKFWDYFQKLPRFSISQDPHV